MEGIGTDGGREQTGGSSSYTISSSSGTIVSSTAYTCSASGLSSISMSMEAASLLDLEIDSDEDEFSGEERKEKDAEALQTIKKQYRREAKRAKEEKMKRMVQVFFATPSATNYSTSALESWFTELGIAWVLHVDGPVSEGMYELMEKAGSWIPALSSITKTILLMAPLFPDRTVGLPNICEEGCNTESENTANVPDQFQFAQFIQNTTFRMLAFVDAIVASNAKTTTKDQGLLLRYESVTTLLRVQGALSRALANIRQAVHSPSSTEVGKIKGEIINLLSAKEGKTNKAIWSTMEQIRTKLKHVCNDASSSLTPQGPPDIHSATWSVMRYIEFMLSHYSSMSAIASEAARLGKYVPQIRDVPHLDSMIVEMVSCVE
ncbi:hypothetical protein U9M48_001973 [Paspalum notatum var. saurae]|uniref:Exocyst subunit Exo70 family protein n=1 Tax=Paspalum notatum var. saurae TaxID=547442 RepID=A0AAQ3SJE5_PASNO